MAGCGIFLKENITAQKAYRRGLLQKIKVTVEWIHGAEVPGSQQDRLLHYNNSQKPAKG